MSKRLDSYIDAAAQRALLDAVSAVMSAHHREGDEWPGDEHAFWVEIPHRDGGPGTSRGISFPRQYVEAALRERLRRELGLERDLLVRIVRLKGK